MLYAEIEPSRLLAANKKPPGPQLQPASEDVPLPAENGEPARGLSDPSALMLNPATALAFFRATYRTFPSPTFNPSGPPFGTVWNGEPATGVSDPFELIVKAEMLPFGSFELAAKGRGTQVTG